MVQCSDLYLAQPLLQRSLVDQRTVPAFPRGFRTHRTAARASDQTSAVPVAARTSAAAVPLAAADCTWADPFPFLPEAAAADCTWADPSPFLPEAAADCT